MNLKYLLCILIFFILRGIAYSQNNDVSNLYIIDKIIDESLVPLENEFLVNGNDVLYNFITDSDNEKQQYISESIKKKFQGYRFLSDYTGGNDSGKEVINVSINNPELSVKYTRTYTDNFLGSIIVERIVTVRYETVFLNSKDSSVIFSNKFSKNSKSSFNIINIGMVEDRRYSFTYSVIPEESTLNKLILPAVVILASAVAVILFFTIRSK